MQKDFTKRILDEINKSGFPLEIHTSTVLNQEGWFVENNPNYFDDKIKEHREIDIVAHKPSKKFKNGHNLLVIECKKSANKPWLFFKQKKVENSVLNMNIAAFGDGSEYKWYEDFMVEHYYSKNFICTYYMVPYLSQSNENRGKNQESDIYRAVKQVMNALIFYSTRESRNINKYKFKDIKFIYPVIIFDGVLLSAFIEENEIDIKEENHILLSINLELDDAAELRWGAKESKLVFCKPFIIDIVKKEYLKQYLENFI